MLEVIIIFKDYLLLLAITTYSYEITAVIVITSWVIIVVLVHIN